jgi:hypothetical protein
MIRAIPRRRGHTNVRYNSGFSTKLNAGQVYLYTSINQISLGVPKYVETIATERVCPPCEVVQPSCEIPLEKLAAINSQIDNLITLFSDPETTIETVISTLRT